MNNTGIYIRVSSEKQFLNGHSLEWQEHLLKEYANNHKLNVVDMYIEKGISGERINNRNELKRLLKDIKNKKINNVLVYKIDRLGRRVETNSVICKILIDNNCTLIASDTGKVELKTAFGSLLYNILSAISQFEVDNLSERVINGKKQRVRDGLYINSYNVYGYDSYCNYDGKRLLKVNDFEKNIVNDIYKSYLKGKSMNNIAKELNKRNIPCKRGGKWCQSTIYQILTNRLYIGMVVYNGNAKTDCFENKGIHQPIIDDELFIKVQDIIKSRQKQKTKKCPNEYSYFSSLLVFENSTFKPKQTKANDKDSIRYYCKDKKSCFPSIKHTKLEEIFSSKLSNYKLEYDEKVIANIFKDDDYEIVLELLNKIKREQNMLFDYYNNNIIKDNELKERLEHLASKKEKLLNQHEELKNRIIDYNDYTKIKIYNLINNNLMINFNKLSKKDKMNFVNLFVEKIIIDINHNIEIVWKKQ